ncbi:putative hemolysin [Rubricella aquisinus]|uniref:Putative hemolysin n=1 Tax=Rubricella aquisinus TaxID=2028108 RepID=A0A840X2G7_9RHOB|nr:lysophospholipid acyltransferase family protein [Rubricella aquisinus]MBB5514867.1 putative hemolysin [Rubricella aquisinus]
MPDSRAARDISYASSAETRGGRFMIRTLENLTGRQRLIRMARGYEHEVAAGRSFWEVMIERYQLGLDVRGGALTAMPAEGPLIVISNHPFGILDGLMLGHILQQTRGDFRILANSVFCKASDLERVILPVSFDETREAVALNLATRKTALSYLAGGGCIGVFPGGTVSTAKKPLGGRAMDPGWRTFTAKMIAKSGATVVPIYFDGSNSRRFQIASHLHPNLRLGLLINEFRTRLNKKVPVVIGDPIKAEEIAARAKNARALMDFLREETYRLSPDPIEDLSYGYEFEERHASQNVAGG